MSSRLSSPGPVVQGYSVELLCEAIAGDLPISYSWIGPDGHIMLPADTDGNISLNINTFGSYTCSGTNAIGTDRESVEIVQAGMHYLSPRPSYFWF